MLKVTKCIFCILLIYVKLTVAFFHQEACYNSYPPPIDCHEDPSVANLIKELMDAHQMWGFDFERLHRIRHAVLKFHGPVVFNSSWYKYFSRNEKRNPLLHNMNSLSLELVITLICSQKCAVDLAVEETFDSDVCFANSLILVTVIAMSRVVARRCKFLQNHMQKKISVIYVKLIEISSKRNVVPEKPILVRRPFPVTKHNNVWKNIFSISSLSELKESYPDNTCSLCKSDVTDDFAVLDNCRHIFCPHCVFQWFRKRSIHSFQDNVVGYLCSEHNL